MNRGSSAVCLLQWRAMNESMNRTILVVDDETDIVELAALYLRDEGFEVLGVGSGSEALEAVERSEPALVVLDIMLPGMDGWEVCRRLRAQGNTPIIMLTARGDAIDRVVGLELGADDYMVKPFHGRELVARIRAVLRRSNPAAAKHTSTVEEEVVQIGDVLVDPARRVVTVGEEVIYPRARAFDLIHYLARHPGIVLKRDRLLEQVWGYDFLGDSRTVDVHVAHVRTHLESSADVTVETVWGVGYKLIVREGTDVHVGAVTDLGHENPETTIS